MSNLIYKLMKKLPYVQWRNHRASGYKRWSVIKLGLWEIYDGLITVLTLGEFDADGSLEQAFNMAYEYNKKETNQ